MRVVSQYSKYVFSPFPQIVEQFANGSFRILDPGTSCEFTLHDVTEWEKAEASSHFKFHGFTQGSDELPSDATLRLSSFDTEAAVSRWAATYAQTCHKSPDESRKWALERKADVEKAFEQNQANGYDFIIVEKPKVKAPWPGYDKVTVKGRRSIELVLKEITEIVKTTGIAPRDVILYEQENLNRLEVIDALEALEVEPELEDDEILVNA